MIARLSLTIVLFGTLGYALAVQPDDPPVAPPTPAKLREDAVLQEQILARQFAQFEQDLFKLILKLKRSTKEEDRLRAEVLEKVLDRAKKDLVSVQFEKIVDQLKDQELKSTGEIKIAAENAGKLADNLRILIALLREDPRQSKLREERMRLEALIKELEGIIHRQKVTQGITDAGRTDKSELGKIQNKVTQETSKFLDKLDGKNGKGGDGKDAKGQAKQGKGGDNAGPGKDVGKDTPKGQTKPPGDQVAKADPKNPKDGAPKDGSPKDGGKPGAPKDGAGKATPKPGEPGEQAGAKGGKPSDQSGEPKKSGSQQAEAKPGESSQGQAQAKQGSPDQGSQKDGPKQPPQPNQPQDNPVAGKKQVQDANEKQQNAEENIAKKDNRQASNDQGDAIEKLEDAKRKLEELLRQIREEELERILADLQRRCEKMLAMQIAVYNGTKGVAKQIADNSDMQPTRENKQDALKLSDQEGEIVVEAKKAIEVLEAEGSAVAFPEVFQQVREDMMHVQRRLGVSDVGQVTQTIEEDIIISLKEMIEALKKAKQDLENKKSNPPPPGSPPPQDSKLLELIQELKLVRSLQIRVNTRTQTYGKLYEGEQTAEPNIRQELINLSERQQRIFDITNRLAKGDNR